MYVASDSERIRDAVSVEDVLKRYHQLGRAKGRTSCPLHGGTNDNLGYSERVWHCFVCGAKGDVIGFVMQLFGMDFKSAVAKLCEDFGIQTDSKLSLADRHKAQAKAQLTKQRREASNSLERYDQWAYSELCRFYRWVREQPDAPQHEEDIKILTRIIDLCAVRSAIINWDISGYIQTISARFEGKYQWDNS